MSLATGTASSSPPIAFAISSCSRVDQSDDCEETGSLLVSLLPQVRSTLFVVRGVCSMSRSIRRFVRSVIVCVFQCCTTVVVIANVLMFFGLLFLSGSREVVVVTM